MEHPLQPLGLIMHPIIVGHNQLYSIREFYSPLTDTKPNKVNLTDLKTPQSNRRCSAVFSCKWVHPQRSPSLACASVFSLHVLDFSFLYKQDPVQPVKRGFLILWPETLLHLEVCSALIQNDMN